MLKNCEESSAHSISQIRTNMIINADVTVLYCKVSFFLVGVDGFSTFCFVEFFLFNLKINQKF